jgi:uncharacterized damage-inducible protein DinB
MEDREFFRDRHRAEQTTFKRVIEALPKDRFDYRPHERSPSTKELVWVLASEAAACSRMIETGSVRWCPDPVPDVDSVLAAFENNSRALDQRVQSLTADEWRRSSRLYIGEKLVNEQPLGGFLWYLFFDAIHHRGQLSTYIRPMGGRVPSIYGPSGDDPGPSG